MGAAGCRLRRRSGRATMNVAYWAVLKVHERSEMAIGYNVQGYTDISIYNRAAPGPAALPFDLPFGIVFHIDFRIDF